MSPDRHFPQKPEGPRVLAFRLTYPAQMTRPIEPILIPKLRIRLAEFPYATLFYAPETAHLGDLMRIRYGWIEAQRIVTQPPAFLGQFKDNGNTPKIGMLFGGS